MAQYSRSLLKARIDAGLVGLRNAWMILVEKGPSQVQFWFIALAIGVSAGLAALLFRRGIELLQQTLYGVEDIRTIHSFAEGLPWFMVLIIPAIGGLIEP